MERFGCLHPGGLFRMELQYKGVPAETASARLQYP